MVTNKANVDSLAGEIGRRIVQDMAAITLEKNSEWVLRNARENKKFLPKSKSLKALHDLPSLQGGRSIIIASVPMACHKASP